MTDDDQTRAELEAFTRKMFNRPEPEPLPDNTTDTTAFIKRLFADDDH